MKKVRKAVIPAAGLGVRMLPASRCVPKEMYPIVDRPAISFLVEEAAKSGITEVLIITGRDKEAIEDYFDYSMEYDTALAAKGREAVIEELHREIDGVNVFFKRQKERKGLGHAVLQARSFIGDEPFAVLYGDDMMLSRKPVALQMIEAYEKYGRPVLGLGRVRKEDLCKYCSMKAEPIVGTEDYVVTDMIEKPAPGQEFSDLSILGRVLLTPEVFGYLEKQAPGAGGEIQLTDSMASYARDHGMTGIMFEGERFDMGNKLGFLKACVTVGLKHPEVGREFAEYIKSVSSKL